MDTFMMDRVLFRVMRVLDGLDCDFLVRGNGRYASIHFTVSEDGAVPGRYTIRKDFDQDPTYGFDGYELYGMDPDGDPVALGSLSAVLAMIDKLTGCDYLPY